MSSNSLFAILLRSPWWASGLLALAVAAISMALLPERYRVGAALSGLPFAVIAAIALRRQWRLPGAERVARTEQALSAMAWPAFAERLEQSFRRDGYSVQRSAQPGVDFELARQGRRTLVAARRWKSARTGLEPLRALQSAREAADVAEALYVGLGPLSDNALAFAKAHRITIWHGTELAVALRGLPLASSPSA